MDQRVYQAGLTYLSRWPLWLVAVIYLVVCGIAIQIVWFPSRVGRAQDVAPKISRPWPMVNILPSTSLSQIDSETRALFWNAEPLMPIKTAGAPQFPKVESLEIVGTLKTADELQILRTMPNLRDFAILADVPAGGWRHIAETPRLRYLRLLELPSRRELQGAGGLADLQVLDLLRIPDYSRVFDDVKQFPNLHTLVLEGPVAATFNAADWQKLRALPRLTQLYLRNGERIPERNRTDLSRVAEILPHVKVRPVAVDELRANVWCFVVFAGMVIWGLLTIQLQTQFSHSGSCVIPNYAPSHLAVAKRLWVFTTAIHVGILYGADCSLLASLAGAMVVPGLFWGMHAVDFRTSVKRGKSSTLNPLLALAMTFQVFPIIAVGSRFFLSDLDWFLAGHHPLVAVVLILFSVTMPILVLRRLPRLHTIYQETLAGVPPLGISPKAWNAWGKTLAATQANPWKSWWTGDQCARLDAIIAAPLPRDWSRLWVAAHGFDIPQALVRVMTFAVVFLGAFRLVSWWQAAYLGWQPQWLAIAAMMGGMWVEGAFIGLILIWRGRRPLLAFELLRPASRPEFVRQLFAAVWRDLRPVLICQIVVVCILSGMTGIGSFPHLFVPTVLCYGVFRAIGNYATILLLLAVRRGWLVFAAVAIIWFVAFFMDGYLALSSTRSDEWYPEAAIALCVAGILATLFVLVWLKGYWRRLELA